MSLRTLKAPRGNKFSAEKVRMDGHTFDSKKEAARYRQLRALEAAGQIRDLELHPVFKIVIEGRPLLIKSGHYRNGRAARYTADFRYVDCDGRTVVEDVKSRITAAKPDYKLRKALVEHLYGITVREV